VQIHRLALHPDDTAAEIRSRIIRQNGIHVPPPGLTPGRFEQGDGPLHGRGLIFSDAATTRVPAAGNNESGRRIPWQMVAYCY
jgi:hypothetical protein